MLRCSDAFVYRPSLCFRDLVAQHSESVSHFVKATGKKLFTCKTDCQSVSLAAGRISNPSYIPTSLVSYFHLDRLRDVQFCREQPLDRWTIASKGGTPETAFPTV